MKTAAAVGALFAGPTAMSTPIDVGDRLQLLWDDHLVDAAGGGIDRKKSV